MRRISCAGPAPSLHMSTEQTTTERRDRRLVTMVEPALAERLERLAREQDRTLSSTVRHLLRERLEESTR